MNSQLNGVHFLLVPTLLLVLYSFMAPTSIAVLQVLNINTDQSSLLAFKHHITYDPNNFLAKNWSVKTPVCNWFGITCASSHLRVTALNLSHMNLVGTIPPHFGNLSFLSELDLSNNTFHGSLPSELARLRRVKLINLHFNNFSGEIPPWFVFLPKLEKLGLRFNSFTGKITPSLFNLTSLQILDLTGNKLWGFLPSNFFNAPALQLVSIYGNQISGSIPSSVFNTSSLQIIDLGENNLSGEVPENIFYYLPKLEKFSLRENQFVGKIPLSLFNCKQLQVLFLNYNNFKGNIPREIGNLTMLNSLYLGYNNLQGTIPNEIGNLHNLEKLNLAIGNLSGQIPSEIFNISTMIEISLIFNQLSGSLPMTLGSVTPNLKGLYLGANYLSGKIPSFISNASLLTHLSLANNSFSGYIPDIFDNLKKLELLNFEANNLTSDTSNPELNIINSLSSSNYLRTVALAANPLNSILPMSIGNLSTSLEFLGFWNCGMRGSIPPNIGNLSGLILLDLGQNQLTGTIPTEIRKLQELQALSLDGNLLEGLLPRVICQLKSLWHLGLASNSFSGPIPTCLSNLTLLRRFTLASNKLNSTIPSDLLSLTYLLYLSLSSNELIGPLPLGIGNLRVLTELYLSDNQLSGNIPSTMGGLQDLSHLDLQRNKLEGPIPESFGSLVSLEELYLSENNLSGVIPKSLEGLVHMKFFNVSFNKLEGEIPSGGPFRNLSSQSFMGNEGLCGAQHLQVPKCKSTASSKSPKTTAIVLKIVLPAAFATLMFILTFIYVLKCKNHSESSNSEKLSTVTTWRRISYHELRQATNQFSDVNLLGIGSFGKVYKGILDDGMNVAVKVFNLELEGGFRSFDSECEVLRNVRHRNLIKVISSCTNDIDFKALVLSYMPNGSLERWLYSDNRGLSIMHRLNIMIDVAAALDYLHHGCSIPIVHCDLKPNNVLLDQDMIAHVTDFGIAKLLGGDSLTHTMTLATMGYMAPEYGLEGIVSRQGDVYSYGILLMETFTGKKPTDEIFHGEFSIKHWVKDSYPDAIIDFISGQLLTEDTGQLVIKKDCLLSIMELALDCSADSPNERRNIKDVLAALKKIKIKFLNEPRNPKASF